MVETYQGRHKEINSEGKRIVIFVGSEGSGKSTLGKKLSEYLALPYISTGDIIREKAKNDKGTIGDACRKMIEEKAYLAPSLIKEMLSERLQSQDTDIGAILDGGLRTLEETEYFDQALYNSGKDNFEVDVIFLDIPDEVGIQRRLTNTDKRPDDTEEGILKRLTHFKENLDERMNLAKERYRFFIIDAKPNIDEVFQNIISVLNLK